jgi:hypothetical protein
MMSVHVYSFSVNTQYSLCAWGTVIHLLFRDGSYLLFDPLICLRAHPERAWRLVRDDPTLPDSGKVSKPNGVVGGLISSREIISLLDGN